MHHSVILWNSPSMHSVNNIQLMVDSSPISAIVGAETPVVGLCESRDSYCWTRRSLNMFVEQTKQIMYLKWNRT